MSIGIFKKRFDKDPQDFESVNSIDAFVERKAGKKLPILYIHPELTTCRGSVFPIEDKDANEIFEAALEK